MGDDDDQDDEDANPTSEWPGTLHYQGPRIGEVPTYPVIMPTHDLTTLDEARVEEFQRAISTGVRPCAVALAWIDSREVRAQWEERFLSLVVLNGHHRL